MRAPRRDAREMPRVDVARPPRDGGRLGRIRDDVLPGSAADLEDVADAIREVRRDHRPDRRVVALERRPAQPGVRRRLLALAEFDHEIGHALGLLHQFEGFGQHAGTGTSTHLAGELLKNLAHVDLNAIPYKGGAPAINDLMGGQIPMSFNNGPESVGQLEAGTLRALAVTTASRASFLPNVPSMAEAVPGYHTEVWWGLLGPASMPADLVAKLSHDFVAALNTEPVKERLAKLGASPIGSSPEQFDAKIRADYKKWGPIIEAVGIKVE